MIATGASMIQACITPEGHTHFLVFAHGLGHDWLLKDCSLLSGPSGDNANGEECRANAYEWFG